MKIESNTKSKIAVIVFLAIIILPACFAALKEYRLRQQKKASPTPIEKAGDSR